MTHWNTVSMANPKLSKLVMPSLGPSQLGRHTMLMVAQSKPTPLEFEHGCGSFIMSPTSHDKAVCKRSRRRRRSRRKKCNTRWIERVGAKLTRHRVVARRVQLAGEQLEPDDRVDDDHEDDEQGNVKERHHGSQNGIQHHLQALIHAHS